MSVSRKNKIAVILPVEDGFWPSCHYILNNLVSSLSLLRDQIDLHFFKLHPGHTDDLLNHLIESHRLVKFDHLLYLDPYHHPASLLKKMSMDSILEDIQLTVVVFGNFLKDFLSWYNFFESFNRKLSLIVASDNQKKLLQQFFSVSINVIPFPVDSSLYHHQNDGRQSRQNGLIFVFAGRISAQKNIHTLIRFLAQAFHEKVLDENFKLKLIGNFDDQYLPFSDSSTAIGTYYHHLCYEVAKEVGENFFKKHIQFLGPLSPQDLAQELKASDIFISLSTFSHEDYGLAAAEALEIGLSSILTKWGGHSSFKQYYPQQVELIHLETTQNSFNISYNFFKEALLNSVENIHHKKLTSVVNQKYVAGLYRDHFINFSADVPKRLELALDIAQKVHESENAKYSTKVLKVYAE